MVPTVSMFLIRHVVPKLKLTMRTLSTTSIVANMNKHSPNYFLKPQILESYKRLVQEECKVFCTYVWIDGNLELRSKCRVLDFVPRRISDIPVWTFNGKSTQQEFGTCCEMYLNPVQVYSDPFHPGKHKLILCETYDTQKNPTETNHRVEALEAAECAQDQGLQFGFEQQFIFIDMDGRPWGWPRNGFMAPEGPYFAGIGANKVFCRCIVDAHKYACLHAGIQYGGNNAEVMPSQWEYQTNPADSIKACDDMWMSRYILHRVAEEHGVSVTFNPKMFENMNGCALNANFSSDKMRIPESGIEEMYQMIDKLKAKHNEHLKVYDPKCGEYNKLRMTGTHDTPCYDECTSGVGDYCKSLRIPLQVKEACYGYIEDRRPAANADPYMVMNAIIRTCFL